MASAKDCLQQRVLLLANRRDGDLYLLQCNAANDAPERVHCAVQTCRNVRDAAATTDVAEVQRKTASQQVTKADLRPSEDCSTPGSRSPCQELLLAETLALAGSKPSSDESRSRDPFKTSFTPTALLSPSLSSPLTVASENNASDLEEHIMQLTRELAVSKAENESLRRQLERCNAQLQEQKSSRANELNNVRQRHSVQVTELNNELAEARTGRANAELAQLKLEGELKTAKCELVALKQRNDASLAAATGAKGSRSRSDDKTVYDVSVASQIRPAVSKPRLIEQATQCSTPESDSPQNATETRELNPAMLEQGLTERCKTLEEQISSLMQQLPRANFADTSTRDVATFATHSKCDASTLCDATEQSTLVGDTLSEVETVHKSKKLQLKAGKAEKTKSAAQVGVKAVYNKLFSENSTEVSVEKSDTDKLLEEIETFRSLDAEKEASIARLHKQLYNMKAAYQDLKEAKDQVEQTIRSEQENNNTQSHHHQLSSEEVQSLQGEVARLKEECERRARDSTRSQSQLQSEKLSLNIDAQDAIIRLMIQLEEERAKQAATERTLQGMLEENSELKASTSHTEQVCRQMEARVQSLVQQADGDLAATVARKTAPITQNDDEKQLKGDQFMQTLAEENCRLTKQAFSQNSQLMSLQTLVATLDADLQNLHVKHDALTRAYSQLREFKDGQRAVIEKLEGELNRLATTADGGQHVPPTHDLLVALLKDRHRMQTEELETLHQRFSLLEKDTALFLERMKHLDAANDEKMKLQVDTVVLQLDKLSSDRLALQTLVLDLKQQITQLNAKLQQPVTISGGTPAEHNIEVHPADEHLKTVACLSEVNEKAQLLQLDVAAETDRQNTQYFDESAEKVGSFVSKEQASTSSADLVSFRDADTSVDESIMQTLAASIAQSKKQREDAKKKVLSTEAIAFPDTPPVTDRSDSKHPVDSRYQEDRRNKPALEKGAKHAVAEDNEELDGEYKVSTSDQYVQVSEWELEKRSSDSAWLRVAQKEKEAGKSLAALFRVHETIKCELRERTEKLHRLENELDLLTEALKLTLNEKLLLSSTLSDVRSELKRCRKLNLETKRKFNDDSIKLNSELVNLNDRLSLEVENSNRTRQLLGAELEAKEARLVSKVQENEYLKQKIEEMEAEMQKLTDRLQEAQCQSRPCETAERPTTTTSQTAQNGNIESAFVRASNRLSNRDQRTEKDGEAVRLLKESVERLQRKVRKEKKLHRISLNRIRSLECDNDELCKQLRSSKSTQDGVRFGDSMDFRGKEKSEIVHHLVAQSEESARLFLATINSNIDNIRRDAAISTR